MAWKVFFFLVILNLIGVKVFETWNFERSNVYFVLVVLAVT